MQKNSSIELIFFDLGNVLVEIELDRFFHAMAAQTGMSKKKFKNRIKKLTPLYKAFECGQMSSHQFFQLFGENFPLKSASYPDFVKDYTGIFEPNQELFSWCRILRQQVRLSIISNTDELHYQRIAEDYALDELFEKPITSFRAGSRKPDPSIYDYALQQLGISPDRALLIDDRRENVLGAQQVGMHAILYANNRKLKRDLHRFFLQIP